MKELNEIYGDVIKLKADINNINEEIDRKKEIYESSIKNLMNDLFIKRAELDMIKNYKVSVRLGDLIEELENLFSLDRNVDKIDYKVRTTLSYFGKKSVEDLIKLNNDSKYSLGYNKNLLCVNLVGTKKTARYNYQPKSFLYTFYLPLDLEAIQSDGKNLLEHSSIETSRENGRKCYTVVVDKNIDDLILDIDMDTLLSCNKPSFYPADKFRDAIDNCLDKESVKIKKRQS